MLKHSILKPWFVIATIIGFACGFFYGLWCVFFTVVFLVFAIISWGAFDIRLGYFTPTIYRKANSADKVLALTFDDGPTAFTAEILDLLEQYDCKATFFCIGQQVQKYPELTKQLLAKGHQVGNHTHTHGKNFGFLNTTQVLAEMEKCNAVLKDCTGKQTQLFRPPFGVTNPSVAKAVKILNPFVIGWSNRSLDTVIKDEERIYHRVVRKLQAGDIILFHDTSIRTVNVLKRFLPYLKTKGYHCVSVDDLLNLHSDET